MRYGFRPTFSTVQTGMFLNCLLKVQDHADIQVNCSRW